MKKKRIISKGLSLGGRTKGWAVMQRGPLGSPLRASQQVHLGDTEGNNSWQGRELQTVIHVFPKPGLAGALSPQRQLLVGPAAC